MPTIDVPRSLDALKLERDAIVLYDSLADIEKEPRRSAMLRRIAGDERRHAEVWATKLREMGADVPSPDGPRVRIRLIILLARLFGTRAVSDLVRALEGDDEDMYAAHDSPEFDAIAADEREHAEIWREIAGRRPVGARSAVAGDGGGRRTAHAFGPEAATEGIRRARAAQSPDDIVSAERWHRAGRSGTMRAVIFGVSDGLVSNLSLVMGVAGAGPEPRFILLAGIAGLLAGASSMAAGEYVSMQSQRELYERQIELERAELEAMPEEEEAELAAVYRSKGFADEEAARIAHRLLADPEHALDTLVREELGLDPDELGSPWGAAAGSFVAFALGAAVPVVPYLFGGGSAVFVASLGLSLVALFAVGAGVSLLTGRGMLFSGARQVAIGAAAAAITFVVGRAIGVSVA